MDLGHSLLGRVEDFSYIFYRSGSFLFWSGRGPFIYILWVSGIPFLVGSKTFHIHFMGLDHSFLGRVADFSCTFMGLINSLLSRVEDFSYTFYGFGSFLSCLGRGLFIYILWVSIILILVRSRIFHIHFMILGHPLQCQALKCSALTRIYLSS